MPITNCPECGNLYEEQSEEGANEPTRCCDACWRKWEASRRQTPPTFGRRERDGEK